MVMNLGFHKVLGVFGVVGQLVASQEGPSSMEFTVDITRTHSHTIADKLYRY
jgi:hypothetical protein